MDQLPLKDIHLPNNVSAWPPAPGWIILAVLLPVLLALGVYLYKRIRRKTALKSAAQMLNALRKEDVQDPLQVLVALSAWLRRVAISTAPRADVASLSGSAWLAYLDTQLADAPFSQGIGRCLAGSQYQRKAPEDVDLDALFNLCERWLKHQKPEKTRKQTRINWNFGKS
jgi:hypothetical protein